MTCVLSYDIGKTGCRVALWRDGKQQGVAEGPGAVGVAAADGVDQAIRSVQQVFLQLTEQHEIGEVRCAAFGFAGYASAPERRDELKVGLSKLHPGVHIVLTSDAVLSHAGALSGEPGVVLAAGTGATALAINADGGHARVDGWGYLLGDSGSGYAIGRAGLDQALREFDGRAGSPRLMHRAQHRWSDLSALPSVIHGADNPARVVASFARDVFAAAAHGDSVALGICRAAGEALAEAVVAAARRAHLPMPVAVSTTGGLLQAGALLTDPFDAVLTKELPGTRRQPAAADALAGGYLLATRRDLPHHALFNPSPDERNNN